MVDRVVESVDLYGRSDQYVVPDTDRCTVEHHAVEVDESPLTDIDVITVVAQLGFENEIYQKKKKVIDY